MKYQKIVVCQDGKETRFPRESIKEALAYAKTRGDDADVFALKGDEVVAWISESGELVEMDG